ncbi:MAG: tRNA (guanosine(37)-N1)-methyltransferase TrmD [Patescibacteria group bacterium]
MITFHLISILPESFESYLQSSILGRALAEKIIAVKVWNPRDFVLPESSGRRTVDDKPYGGGPGMVLAAEPILKAVEKIGGKPKVFIFSPAGKQFDNKLARKLAKSKQDLVLIAGRYEGIDARVKKILKAQEVSIGPYVLSGGELPALVMVEAIARQIPGVLGKFESVEENRSSLTGATASSEVYTRPEVLNYEGKNYRVPKVLLSGHHAEIEAWRLAKKKRA